ARALEKRVPCGACRILERSPLSARAASDILPIDQRVDAERCRELHDEPLVAIRRRAQLVVEMDESGKTQFACAVELSQNMRDRGRIRAAGVRRERSAFRPDQIVLTDESADTIDDHRAGMAGRALPFLPISWCR